MLTKPFRDCPVEFSVAVMVMDALSPSPVPEVRDIVIHDCGVLAVQLALSLGALYTIADAVPPAPAMVTSVGLTRRKLLSGSMPMMAR